MKLSDFIGQETAKSRIQFHLDGYEAGQPFPSMLLVSPRGLGKTHLCSCIGSELQDIDKKRGLDKKFYIVNSASIKNAKAFAESILIPLVQDKNSCIFFDEAHKLSESVSTALLTCIAPNAAHMNTYAYNDMNIDVDLRKCSFLFATTCVQALPIALANRCRRTDITDYPQSDIEKIILKNSPNIRFTDGTLSLLASVSRFTPRNATMYAEDVASLLAPLKVNVFNSSHWQMLKHKTGILPLGLSGLELAVLKILAKNKDSSLTRIAATLNMDAQSIRQDAELYNLKNGLMEISRGSGRNLTNAGAQYLKALQTW